ncbi:irregular chiasm C-roughest protein-like [Tigriopus californicus]|uniref:irregular chiasm C-roughest protein-like n=1 Tax=Tigriopus californicus TaxID=6832 RepID=UPI0027D9F814|nr:irregular chiasm C-roughest protein-like [Tigriopus californicus]
MYLWNFKAFMLFAACATGGFKTALAQLTKGDGTDNGIAPQKFLRQPADQTAIQGEHVTLPCRVENKLGMLQWTRDGFGLGTERNLTGFDRYHMSGSDDEGDFTLDIDPVVLEDDALFQCQVGAAEGVDPIRSSDAKLTILVPPEAPVILNGPEMRTTEDREVEFECISRGGKPAAEITWIGGSGTVIETGITKTTNDVENTKRLTTISKLKLTAKKAHHNTTLTCQAQNSADRQPKSTSVFLTVEYAPDVTVTVDHTPLYEGDTAVFTCTAHANPSDMSYRWFMDNNIVTGNHGTQLRLESLSRQQNNKIVKCEVSNKIGKSEETETLNINYSPKFIEKPKDVSGERDQDATLTCEVDGNPATSYTWFKNGDFQTVRGYTSKLTVKISEATIGKYICRASVKDFQEISASAEIMMKGPPHIIRRNSIQYGYEGTTIRLTCDAFAIPPPNTIIWGMHGYSLPPSSDHYAIEEEGRKDGMKSTLIIHDSVEADFADYNCTVRNSHGEDSFVITLEQQNSLPIVIILSAIIGGIILTMFVIMVMVVCRKTTFTMKREKAGKSLNGGTAKTNGATNSLHREGLNNGAPLQGPSDMKPLTSGLDMVDGDEDQAWDHESLPESIANGPRLVNGYGDYNQTNLNPLDGHVMGNHHAMAGDFMPSHPSNYNPNYGYLPPPPPPHPSHQLMAQGSTHLPENGNPYNGLNVSDPRYSAKYGNPYLRTSNNSMHGSPQMNLRTSPRPVKNLNNNGRPYATLNNRLGSNNGSGYHHQSYHAGPQDYSGTMVGNGGGATLRRSQKPREQSHVAKQQKSSQAIQTPQQYIVSPEKDSSKNSALATHV